jgi:hypothetical protein
VSGAPGWSGFADDAPFREFLGQVEAFLAKQGNRHILGEGVAFLERPGENPAQFPFQPLAAICSKAEPKEWPDAISAYFRRLLTAEGEERQLRKDARDFEAVRSRVKLRLYPEEVRQSPVASQMIFGNVAPGIVAAPVFDLPNLVVPVPVPVVRSWGKQDQEVYELALANVMAAHPVTPEVVPEPATPRILALRGENLYVATHLLLLHRHLDRLYEHGVVVAVPANQFVLYHPIVDADAAPAIKTLYPAALGMHKEALAKVSPFLYWWRNGSLTRLDAKFGEGSIEFFPPAELLKILETLGSPLK